MKVRDLVRELEQLDPEAPVVISAGGHQLPFPHLGVGLHAGSKEPCLVVADRPAFAGRLPDLLLRRQ